MPIQTSQITTDANGDLTIAPNGTGATKVTSVAVTRADAGTTEDTPVSVAQDGTVKKVDYSTFPEITTDNLVATDLVAVQKADGDFYYVKAEDLSSAGLVNPDPSGGNATLTVTPNPGTGAGTAASPFVLTSVTVTDPGGTEQTVETFAISGAPANGILYITFTDNQGGRFQDKVVVADAAGNIPAFRLTFIDEPESTVGTVYTGKVRFGTASTYFQWAVTQQAASTDFNGSDNNTDAPNASPSSVDGNGYFGTGSGTWADGTKSLSSSGDIRFRVNGGSFATGPTTANNGDTVEVIFLQSAVDAAASGDTISGTLVSSDNTFSKTFSMVKDSSPTVSLGSTSNAAVSSSTASADTTPTNFNSTISVTAGTAGADEMTNILVSINGGAYSALPQTMNPGDTLSVQGDTGSASNTTYTANINVGGTSVTYSATTSATVTSATISKPGITSPTDGSTGLRPSVVLSSSSYIGNNSPGPHASSDWEVYEAAGGTGAPTTEPPASGTYTLIVSSFNDPTNLRSYTLTNSELSVSKSYYSRVRYSDDGSTGSTITSDFSDFNEFTANSDFTIPIGDATGGGYYAGQINDAGTIYNLIVAPIVDGGRQGQTGGLTLQEYPIKSSGGASLPAATFQNEAYGAPATVLGASDGQHPLFNWCINDVQGPNVGTYDATNTTGTGLGGFNDWYIPAKNELEILYRYLKPGPSGNNTGSGQNANANPPTTNYTVSNPQRTTNALFQSGGAQELGEPIYLWSSTEYSTLPTYNWNTYIAIGKQDITQKTIGSGYYGRAIRREAA